MGCKSVVWRGLEAKYNWVARKWMWGLIRMDIDAEREWAVARS